MNNEKIGKTQRRNVQYILALAEVIKKNQTLSQEQFVRCCNIAATRTANTTLNHQADGSDENLRTEVHQLGTVLSQLGLYNTKSRKDSVFSLTFVRGGLIKANLKLDQLREILRDENSLKKFQAQQTSRTEKVVKVKGIVPKPQCEEIITKLSKDNTKILGIIKDIINHYDGKGVYMEDLGKFLFYCSYISPFEALTEAKDYIWGTFSSFLREDRGYLFFKNLEARARADRMIATLKGEQPKLIEGRFMALLPDQGMVDSLSHLPQVKSIVQLIVPGGIQVHVTCQFEDAPHQWNEAAASICPLCKRAIDVDEFAVFSKLQEVQASVLDNRDLSVLLKRSSLVDIDDPHRLRAIANSLIGSFAE